MLREQLPMTDTQRRPVHLLQVSLSHVLSEAFLPQEMRSWQRYILPAAPILEPIDPALAARDKAKLEVAALPADGQAMIVRTSKGDDYECYLGFLAGK